MKINLKKKAKSEDMYKVGNVIKDENNILYLITTNIDDGYSIIDLNNNQVFGTYKTLEDLYIKIGDETDTLVNVEINEIQEEHLTLTSLKTVNTDLCLFERCTFTKTVNQDLTNNDINSIGLVSVAGC